MNPNPDFHISAPATSANLGSGFDCLGIALNLRNDFQFSQIGEVKEFEIFYEGEGSQFLKNPEKNLLIQAYSFVCQKLDCPEVKFRLNCTNRIPLEGGMGSSATAILAGIAAGYKIQEHDLNKEQILNDAIRFENHADNLGACLYGGFTAGYVTKDRAAVLKHPIDNDLKCLIVRPHLKINTIESRNRLPVTVHFQDAVYSLNRACVLTMSMIQKRYDLFFEAMKDKLHEPFRAPAKLNYPALKLKLKGEDFFGWAISGSGPSVLIFCREFSPKLTAAIENHFAGLKIPYDLYRLDCENQGILINGVTIP